MDALDHWTCCLDDNVALCGADVTDEPWAPFDVASCTVCEVVLRSRLESGDCALCPLEVERSGAS
jgi:hypothetical protein